jgi:hypothetical protein
MYSVVQDEPPLNSANRAKEANGDIEGEKKKRIDLRWNHSYSHRLELT